MSLALYAAATGMEAQELKLANTANNLANINTTGFKKSKVEFQDLLYNEYRPKGGDAGGGSIVPSGVEIGNGAQVISTSKVFTQGKLEPTGESMDFAIQGDGFFEVQRPDGTSAYTKDGALKIGADGRVVTADGMVVLSGWQPVPSGGKVFSSSTGEITIETPTGGAQSFRIQLTRFANPGGLRNLGGNRYEETEASGTPEAGKPGEHGWGSMRQGYLETSNVDVASEMIELIKAQRAYEANSKSVQAADESMRNTNNLKH